MGALLTWIVFLPLAGALGLLLVPRERAELQRWVAIGTTLVVALLGIRLWAGFDGATAGIQHATEALWFTLPGSGIDVHYRLGVDGISILMVALTAVLMPIVIASSRGHVTTRVREFLAWMLVMETGMLGVFLALDLVLFYVFWEVSLIPLYFVIGIWGSERRLYATLKFFLYTFAGSLVMMIGVIWLIYRTGSSDVSAITELAAGIPLEQSRWIFLAFALAFAIKVPLLPFHTWLADAHTEAPASGSVLLAGVLLKMGTYGLLRFGIAMFPAPAIELAPVFLALGGIGIVYGALLAMAQSDIKRLIACSSVSHLGFVVIGLFAMTQAGLRGGVLQMVNHGISTGLLFLLVGMIYERRHTRLISEYGGIAARAPLFAFFFVFAVLSSVGLPGLNGFVGEYMILLGTFEAAPLWAVIGTSGVILGAVYLLSATRRMLFGPLANAANRAIRDLAPREVAILAPMVLLAVWIGVRPDHFTGRTAASIDALVERLDDARDRLASGAERPSEPRLAEAEAER